MISSNHPEQIRRIRLTEILKINFLPLLNHRRVEIKKIGCNLLLRRIRRYGYRLRRIKHARPSHNTLIVSYRVDISQVTWLALHTKKGSRGSILKGRSDEKSRTYGIAWSFNREENLKRRLRVDKIHECCHIKQ